MRHLLLDLDAPLMSFGGDMVYAFEVVRDFPAKSMIPGLLANALGWERYEADAHARLQERLAMGSARVAEGRRVRDFQTAKLEKNDRGWRTNGRIEGRDGASYGAPHIRYRDADADARVLVALRLDPADPEDERAPDLDALAAALDRPERPLFLGRKPFLPSRPVALGIVEAESIYAALAAGIALLPQPPERIATVRAQWPIRDLAGPALDAAMAGGAREEELTDERHWPAGVHAGLRRVMEGTVAWPEPAVTQRTPAQTPEQTA